MGKKWVGVILVVLLVLGTVAIAFQNEPDGFRGLKWGDPPTEDMVYIDTNNNIKSYTRPGDKLGIGNAEFYILEYDFYEGRFIGIFALFINKDNYDILQTICEEKFGKPTERDYYELHWWGGEISLIHLEYDPIEENGCFIIESYQICLEKYKADKQKELEEAKEDF